MNYDRATSKRLISGIKNNMPNLLPDTRISANVKKRTLSEFGMPRPIGRAVSELPMAAFPTEIDPILRCVATKLGLALYYHHKGTIAPINYLTMGFWAQQMHRYTMSRWAKVAEDLTGVEIGARRNINFGNRFGYRWAVEEDGHGDIFIAISHFGKGLVTCSIVCDPRIFKEGEWPPEWLTVGQWAKKEFHPEWLDPYQD